MISTWSTIGTVGTLGITAPPVSGGRWHRSVQVIYGPPAAGAFGTGPDPVAGITVATRSGVRTVLVHSGQPDGPTAPAGPTGPTTHPPLLGTDDHFAVDADTCAEGPWLACADVLVHSRPRQRSGAWLRLNRVLARHAGCRLVALPLLDGSCAVADRDGTRCLLRLAEGTGTAGPERWSQAASCLHGLLSTGHTLDGLRHVSFLTGP
ncbi:hypothetical protein OEIGOIKO_04263 [Streptomyces chrestomyceticus JCM 4735]|uniref:Uncharacterized protein n=1 Tax=Streptomyces chrestomyceticus JCM 4735 TaxID=1306181 RepID=A0A7U9PZ58_9ACTN|nr:hypothetical protein [Streptomyces chrestomyceticus]GCD36500.1 hypothetical protein OEIGOIKO_04263 [Streptomyces chrestomyceticus JCM 4735]